MPSAPAVDCPATHLPTVAKAAKVTVTVNSEGTIVCSPDPINVKRGQSVLKFQLQAPGYVFRQKKAIVVSNPGRDFPLPSVTSADGVTATLRDEHLDCCDYKYSVYLMQVSSGRIICVDPVIRNDPD
ncbi:MAG: hypothetical protein JNN03_04150 [Rubrivivax sp.]|nr:hypothetical protein [Rubrivivax sp.]